MSMPSKNKKHIEISDNYYPSDKDLFDLLRGQKISKKRLKDFLRDRGIVCSFENASTYAEIVCELILEDKDFSEILSFSNVREHRFKTSTIKLSAENLSKDAIIKALNGNPYGEISPDSKIKLPTINNPAEINGQTNEIVIKQSFSKIDYSKTTLLQETKHELLVKINEKADKTFEMTIHSSTPEAELLVGKLKDRIYSDIEKLSFHEIIMSELTWEERNDFFDKVIYNNEFSLESVEEVKLANSAKEKIEGNDETDCLEESEDEHDNDEKDEPVIKSLTLQGTSILQLPEVTEWKKNGYYIKSITGTYRKNKFSSSSDLLVSIQTEFTKSGVFQVQAKKTQLVDDLNLTATYNLDLLQKESITSSINNTAFSVFDEIRTKA